MTRRVIFLDVDGVLNHAAAFRQWKELFGSSVLDPECVRRLVALVKETGAEVVLSSTWRLIEDAREIIRVVLWTHGVLIVDATPDLWNCGVVEADRFAKHPTRADEIHAWLGGNRDVAAFVVLDDDDSAGIEGHFVLTDWEGGGLTDAKAAEARAILERGLGTHKL